MWIVLKTLYQGEQNSKAKNPLFILCTGFVHHGFLGFKNQYAIKRAHVYHQPSLPSSFAMSVPP